MRQSLIDVLTTDNSSQESSGETVLLVNIDCCDVDFDIADRVVRRR